MPRVYEFNVDEIYVVPCRYQVAAESEEEARHKAGMGSTVQNDIDGSEEFASRKVKELVAVFDV